MEKTTPEPAGVQQERGGERGRGPWRSAPRSRTATPRHGWGLEVSALLHRTVWNHRRRVSLQCPHCALVTQKGLSLCNANLRVFPYQSL